MMQRTYSKQHHHHLLSFIPSIMVAIILPSWLPRMSMPYAICQCLSSPLPSYYYKYLLHSSPSPTTTPNPASQVMAVSGFEGFEKRLEINFSLDHPLVSPLGLRLIHFDLLEQLLAEVQCTVVSALANAHFDAYVLSESSMFVYPTRVIIKTCGTTQLLKSARPLILLAAGLGLTICRCRYTHGSFLFPESQPFPHRSFHDEVSYLENSLPARLCNRKSSVMRPDNMVRHRWHVFTATERACSLQVPNDGMYTIEVCMTELDRMRADKFYHTGKAEECAFAKMTTRSTGIGDINPRGLVCDFAFEPCGYSMNGMDKERYSTIHVTPEAGFSYASYECVGMVSDDRDYIMKILTKMVEVFGPGCMSISITGESVEVSGRVKNTLEALGLKCWDRSTDEFPGSGTLVFQTFKKTWSGGSTVPALGGRPNSTAR